MTKVYILAAILFLTVGLISCNDEEKAGSEFTEEISPIVDAKLPENGEINKKITFTINHGVYNGCGQYSRHETVIDGRDIFVTFYAKYPISASCTQNAPVLSTSYEFTPVLTGEYIFHFRQGGEEYLLKNLIIN